LIRDPLAGHQLNFNFHRFSFFSQLRALSRVSGDRHGWSIDLFVIRRGAKEQEIFARRHIAERE